MGLPDPGRTDARGSRADPPLELASRPATGAARRAAAPDAGPPADPPGRRVVGDRSRRPPRRAARLGAAAHRPGRPPSGPRADPTRAALRRGRPRAARAGRPRPVRGQPRPRRDRGGTDVRVLDRCAHAVLARGGARPPPPGLPPVPLPLPRTSIPGDRRGGRARAPAARAPPDRAPGARRPAPVPRRARQARRSGRIRARRTTVSEQPASGQNGLGSKFRGGTPPYLAVFRVIVRSAGTR